MLGIVLATLWSRRGVGRARTLPAPLPLATSKEFVEAPLTLGEILDGATNHTRHIEVVELRNGELITLARLEEGMLNHSNHGIVGEALRNPNKGIRWHDGKIEMGKE